MIYGYARVSSRGQERDGSSLESQERELLGRGCQVVYKEAFTGTKMNRPVFDELVAKLQPGDTLMVTKLDRFARTVVEGTLTMQELVKRGVIVDIINFGRVEDTPMGKFLVGIMLQVAELERSMIMERMNEGKRAKRERGEKCAGRDKIEIERFDEYVEKNRKGEMTVTECCKALGISRTLWYSRLKEVA